MKEYISELAIIIGATLILSILFGGLILEAAHSSNNDAKVRIACFQSGQSWVHNKNGWEECVPKEKAFDMGN